MILGVLAPIAVLGSIALIVVLFVQRGRDGVDLSPRGVIRVYMYLASLAGIVVLALGLASVVNYGMARTAGNEFIYGGSGPVPAISPRCPPGSLEKGCVEFTPEMIEQERVRQKMATDRRRDEDLVRGVTFTAFGVLFWGAHWVARRGLGEGEGGLSGLRRGYLMLGTVVFGLSTIVLLPTGIYQALSNVVLPAPENYYRQGADALGGGVVSLPLWLLYLRLVVSEFRTGA